MKSFENIKKILRELESVGFIKQADTVSIRSAIIKSLDTVCYKTIDSYFFGMVQAGIITKQGAGIWSIKSPFKKFIPVKKKGTVKKAVKK